MASIQASQPAAHRRVQKMGSSQNLNHLLNFTLPPRQTRPPVSIPRRSKRTGTQQGVWNKERMLFYYQDPEETLISVFHLLGFVNAQYRFVMNPTGDYTVHFADPDIYFQWQDILQVIVPRSSALASASASKDHGEGITTCPICLSEPTAPRMTKCGHIYCFPCILHYLSQSENKWVQCPICFDSVNERQLKAVKWYNGPHHLEDDVVPSQASSSSSALDDDAFDVLPRTGSMMQMRLVQRPQITTLALPRSRTWPSDLLPPHQAPFHFLPDVFSFAKFMLSTPDYLVADLTNNLDELAIERRILAGMGDSLGIIFVDGAIQKVQDQITKATALETSILREQIDKVMRDHREIEKRQASASLAPLVKEPIRTDVSEIPLEFLALRSSEPSRYPTPLPANDEPPRAAVTPNRNGPKQRRNVNPPPPSTSTYYYYQAASGLPLFLHPLDIKILLSHFKSYSSFPDSITFRVEAFAEGTVNDDLRKRCKYLAHMPEGADVVFIEADLSSVVGTESLKNFEGALKMRSTRRREKEKKDDRARTRAEEKEKFNSPTVWLDRTTSHSHSYSAPVEEHEEQEILTPAPTASASGAWGARSFASALHSAAPSGNVNRPRSQPREVDEWDVDAAWHELERNSGGRKKRGARLVILGSGSGGGRRR
ncbi:hypothetical protein H0H93_005734 [Arthromyces matolae]|nr:hypothetical protein H0H93_005734 [Arthromyces matolae]